MEPVPPGPDDCCNSGCNPCILDVYEEQLKKFQKKQLLPSPTTNCISLTTYSAFDVVRIVPHTQDTFFYTFQYSHSRGACLVYKPGQHFLLKGFYNDEYFTRAYTPIPLPDDNHSFTILAKLYSKGCMSSYLKSLKVGKQTQWRGPHGDYTMEYQHQFMLLIAQGTGIAPLFAVLHDMLHNDDCETFLKLFLCCRSGNDLVLRDQLYDLTSFWNFTYEVFLSEPEPVTKKYNETINLFKLTGTSFKGYFSEVPVNDVRVLVSGSEAFMDDVVGKLVGCGVESSQIFRF